MKLKFFSLVAVITTIGITATPIMAQVQSPTIARPNSLVAQNLPMEEDLNLTAEQKEQLEQIRENTASQIKSILNPEQQEQFESLRGDRSNLMENMEQLNLTDAQHSQIQEIMNSYRQEMSQVLTDEQNQMLEERRRQSFGDRSGSLKGNSKQFRGPRKVPSDDMEDIREDHFDDMEDIRADRFDDIKDIREDHFDDMEDIREDHFDDMEDIREDRRDDIKDFLD